MNATNTCPERANAPPTPLPPIRAGRTAVRNHDTRVSPQFPPREPRVGEGAVTVEATSARRSSPRRLFLRCARVVLTGALLAGAGVYARQAFLSATSEEAYINGGMTVLRAPIGGQLRLGEGEPGAVIRGGANLFRLQDSGFGNAGALAQRK